MAHQSIYTLLNNELDELKKKDKRFSPSDLGKKYGEPSKRITGIIGMRSDVQRIQKATDRKPSIWGFIKDVTDE